MATSSDQDSTSSVFLLPAVPLFPGASTSGSQLPKSSSLFPAADENENKEGGNVAESFNWLQNHSFNKDAADSYQKFFQESQKAAKVCNVKVVDEEDLKQPEEKRQKLHKKKKKMAKKKKKKHKTSSAEALLELERQLIAQNSKKVFIEDVGLKPEHAFRVDRKPDQVLSVFKAMYHLHLARYVTRNSKRSLGEELVYKAPNDKETRKKLRSSRYFSKKNMLSLCTEDVSDLSSPRLVYKNNKFQKRIASYAEYIPLEISLNEVKTENASDVDPLRIHDDETKAYLRNLESGSTQTCVENTVNELSKVSTKETSSKYATRRTAEFNQQLRENPNNEDCWLDFIHFQDEASSKFWTVSSAEELNHSFKKPTEKDMYERKLAIFEKALAANPKSVKLAVAKLHLCIGYCDFNKLRLEWKQLTFVHPNSIYVWQEYLSFLQTNFSSFTFNSVIKGYEKCLATLSKFVDGSFKSHLPPPDLEGNMIEIIFQLCHFLRQTGHCERAIAVFQALIEFNYYAPDNLQTTASNSDWLAFFEPFWDSGVPRFGEKRAIGWAAVMQKKQLLDMQELKTNKVLEELEDDVVKAKLLRNETWVKIEKLREIHHWLPWRANPSDQDDDCDDPERAVLVDDVASFLFRFQNSDSKIRLLNAFLAFLGLNFPVHFTTVCALSHCHDSLVLEVPSQVISSQKYFVYKFEKPNALPDVFTLSDFFPFDTTELIDNVIEQAQQLVSDVGLYQTNLKVRWMQHKRLILSRTKCSYNHSSNKQAAKDIRKCFKNLLKEEENRNNLALWFEYAKLELDQNNIADVRKVLELTLRSHPKGPLQMEDKEQASLLCGFYRLYAEAELDLQPVDSIRPCDVGNYHKSLHIVTSLSTGEPYSAACEVTPVLILKARRCYHSALKTASDSYKLYVQSAVRLSWLMSIKSSFLVELVPCYAIFQYLTLGLHPAAVLYDGVLDMISELDRHTDNEAEKYQLKLDMELLYLSYVRLLLHHVNTTPSSLKTVRTVITRALHTFPNNSYLLQLLLDIESRSNIAGRLRKHFSHWLQRDQTPVIGIYAVLAELNREQSLKEFQLQAIKSLPSPVAYLPTVSEIGIKQKIQAVFERALALSQARHCPLLWRLYLKFQFLQGHEKKAKAIFYRALQCCPWNKALYLDAAEMFPDDLQQVLDIMTEKEIRIRAPIEEIDLLTGFVASNDGDGAADVQISNDTDVSVEQGQAKV